MAALIYGVVVAFLAWHHELWRDEGRALNIAWGSHSLGELFHNLRNEGHPALWYLLLYAGCRATGSMLVLKPVSGLVAVLAMYVFFRWSPWPRWQKALFAAGVFPLYEYSVMCRNYGVSMLLLFVAAALYRGRFTRPLPLAVALALLANTNAYALVVVLALVVSLALERWLAPPARTGSPREALGAALVLAIGVACSVWVMYPDQTTTVTDLHGLTAANLSSPLAAALVLPGHFFFTPLLLRSTAPIALRILAGAGSLAVTAAIWTAALSLLPRPWLSVGLLAGVAGCSLLSDVVYSSSLRHWGQLYLLLVVLLWVQDEDRRGPSLLPRVQRWGLTLLLGAQAVHAAIPMCTDLLGPSSSSERLGVFIGERAALHDALILGEPDFLLEALPYYAQNPIYQPREGRYLLKVDFTAASQPALSLDELMATAARLHQETGRPVLIVMGHKLRPQGPFTVPAGYHHSTFTYSPDSLRDFLGRTERLTRFDGADHDENYTVYLWKGAP